MKKEFRLKRTQDFKKVFREGKVFRSPRFILYMRKNTLPNTRIGISISKIHFKLATRRNRLRRIAKELFRKEIAPGLKGYDVVITSRETCPSSNINEAVKELKHLILELKRQRHDQEFHYSNN